MIVHRAVGQDKTPHHFGEHHLLADVVVPQQTARVAKVIDCLSPFRLGRHDEVARRVGREREVTLHGRFEVGSFVGTERPVGIRHVEQQNARRQRYVVGG